MKCTNHCLAMIVTKWYQFAYQHILLGILASFHRRYMTKILPITSKTISNQSASFHKLSEISIHIFRYIYIVLILLLCFRDRQDIHWYETCLFV